jgi:riboflavin kinase/FMN adenylyltransferase
LRPDISLAYLTTPDERAELIEALGADFTLILPFSRATAATSAADFMRALVERLNLRELWAGPDFALGRGREGNVERLAGLGTQMGYTVRVAPPVDLAGVPVRSSWVRSLLAEAGNVEGAAQMLGRPYSLKGEVTAGAHRGRQLGYPTANIAVPAGRQVPANGIYACWAWLDTAGFPAAVSIGTRPTFDNGLRTVEAYLLDFGDDLYGQTLGVSFIGRLRPELRFPDAGALVAQMDLDVRRTRAILGTPRDDAGANLRDRWEELPHTADWAIRVQAETQRQLFARAAAAMYALQDVDIARPVELARAFSARAADAPELLVAFLSRLLLDQEVAGEMYTRFEIDEISDRGLQGVAYGYRGTPTHTAIKAVTYYDLNVQRRAGSWEATVTFDV